MRNRIQTGLAVLVIVVSLAFTTIGIARAASGYQWNPKPLTGISFFSMSGSGETATPTAMAQASETAEPRQMMDDGPQHSSNSYKYDEDSGDLFEHDEDQSRRTGTPPPYDHDSGPYGDGGGD